VRRNLAVVVVLGSLLWCASGAGVLLVAAHEHLHHDEKHGHEKVFQAAIHGHAHESSPDHEHELSAPLTASRVTPAFQMLELAGETAAAGDHRRDEPRHLTTHSMMSAECGPRPYLANCVLLT
jgi:hypothetical protein